MNLSPEAVQSLYILTLVVGFIGYAAFGPLPAPGQGVSRMGYFVRTGALALGSTIAIMLAVSFLSTFAAASYSSVYPVTAGAIGLAAGSYAGMIALGRSKDSGGGRGFAAVGVIPFVNLWLAFAAPAPDPARPPYWPRNGFLRFLVGFLVLFFGSGMAGGLGAWMESPAGTAAMLDREIASLNAGLPQRLDEITVLTAVRHEPAQRRIVYQHTLEIPADADTAGMGERLKSVVAPNVCADQAVLALLDGGYALDYAYATSQGTSLPGFTLAQADCR